MPLQSLTWDQIGELDDGRSGLMIDQAIAEAVRDLDDRGSEDGEARKVLIQIDMVIKQKIPHITVQAKVSKPNKRTAETKGKLREKSGVTELVFRTDNPDNPDQPTFLDEDGGEITERKRS